MLLAKIIAVGILVWFFHTAKENGQEPFKWAIIGLVGYGITWEAAHLITDALTANKIIAATIPALIATVGAWLIRQKLISDAKKDV
jgi:putative flippase GtrA